MNPKRPTYLALCVYSPNLNRNFPFDVQRLLGGSFKFYTRKDLAITSEIFMRTKEKSRNGLEREQGKQGSKGRICFGKRGQIDVRVDSRTASVRRYRTAQF